MKNNLENLQRNTKYNPVRIVPFELYNIGDFIEGTPPLIHPDSDLYDIYWTQQATRCIEGFWGYDYNKKRNLGGWRFMPGNLYFYTNYGIINAGGDENTTASGPPLLRDVEWLIFYGLTACDGFSGFYSDPEYCCFRPIGKLEKGLQLNELDKLFLDKYGDNYRDKKGKFKKYLEAKSYLYRTVPEPFERAMFNNTALNFELLSTRRLGKSFSIGEGVGTYDLVFNGARTFSDYMNKSTKSTVVIGSSDYKWSAELIEKIEMGYNNLKDIGAYRIDGKNVNGAFWHPTDLFSKGFKESGGVISNAVVTKTGQGKEGVGSKLVHVSYKDNASSGVGYGARRMITEESGLLRNFNAVHGENTATQMHDYKYGYSIYIGTGGNVERIKEIKDSFYNPRKYDILPYPSVLKGGKETALFIPCPYKNNQFRDENGNLDVDRSYRYEVELREAKKGSSNYQKHTISFPLVAEEMFVQSLGNKFNTEALEDRITELEEGDLKYSVGTLQYIDEDNRKVLFKPDLDGKLTPFLRRGDEVKAETPFGAFVVYEHPAPYKPERHAKNPLYLVIYDPVSTSLDEDNVGGSSLCAVIVLKLYDFNDSYYMLNVVAEWYGRFQELDDNHAMAFKIADYYSTLLFPETNDDDILRYAKRVGRYNDLMDKPDTTAGEFSVTKKKQAKGFFIPPGEKGKPVLVEYLNDLLSTVVYKEEAINGEKFDIKNVRVVNRIPSIRVCEELKDYNFDDNFDAVSCLLLGGLYFRSKRLEPIIESRELEEDAVAQDFSNFFSNYAYVKNHPAFNY